MSTLTLLRFSPPLLSCTRPLSGGRPGRPIQFSFSSAARPNSIQSSRLGPITSSYPPSVPASERLISALSFTLPLLNSLHYGRFLFSRAPALGAAVEPLLPLLSAYRAVPYAAFVAFFALYLGVVRNTNLSRYVRFNAMQAVVLDVLLALPSLALRVFGVPSRGVGLRVLEVGYTSMFIFMAACFIYGLASSVFGRTPYIPIVAAAADRQL